MEGLLNVLWLVIALGVVGLWRTRWSAARASRRRRPSFLHEAMALACALLLLFPVISLTDDLHPAFALAEDSVSSKRALQAWTVAHAPLATGKLVVHQFAVILARVCSFSYGTCRRVVQADALPAVAAPRRCASGRSPPAFSL